MPLRLHRTPLPLVRVSAFVPFLDFLKQIGTPIGHLLHSAKLRPDAMDDPDALIPLRNACIFLDAASRSEDIAHLGFCVGIRTPIESLGAFGLLVRRSATLWEAFNTAESLVSTLSSGFALRLERAGQDIWVHHRNLIPDCPGSPQADGFGLMMIVNLIRLATQTRWRPRDVRLQMPHHRDLGDLEPFGSASLRFGPWASAIAVPAALLSQPLAHRSDRQAAPPELSAEWLRGFAPATDLSGSVRQFLRSRLSDGHSDIHSMAAASGLGVRTLQRRLVDEGTGHARLVEQTRFERAVELLRGSGMKIIDVAQELGYRDAANFTRAFRRWTGISPSAFRNTAQP